ncbi:MAG: thymidine phosphorylase [Spirochaetota bacterium]
MGRACEVIVRKRDGNSNTCNEIEYMVRGCTDGSIPDYQLSAWLMACFLNGLDADETLCLTRAMLHSGELYDLSGVPGPRVDKHSTGGVGDKVSLVLAPAVAACGVYVPMTSGRGLGFTGGTLDKLESIPGFQVNLSPGRFVEVLQRVGYVMSGQTDRLAPADRKLYALRDVTGTVESVPLITASILSKKFAEGADAVVMDVKSGSGAFMATVEQARELARTLVDVGARLGRRVICMLTNMDQPLGRAVGNSLEVIESVACLRGEGPGDVRELVLELGARMLLAAGVVQDPAGGRALVAEKLDNGEALQRFVRSVEEQGGDPGFTEDTGRLPAASCSLDLNAPAAGFVHRVHAGLVGRAAVLLGAGRSRMDEPVDHAAGVTVHRKVGDRVREGEPLLTLHGNREQDMRGAAEVARGACVVGGTPAGDFTLIHDVLP